MNKFAKVLFAFSSAALLLGCNQTGGDNSAASENGGGNQGGDLTPSASVFATNKIYFQAKEEKNVSVQIEIKGNITSISCGRSKAKEGEYAYKDGVLTLSGSFLKEISAGEKDIRIATSSGNLTLSALCADKIITTAEEFQNINDNLDGTYVLGNDIDLSSIDNFEPLGRYVSEEDTSNHYFHGILEGNGHTVKNAKVYWSDDVGSNLNVYNNSGTTFKDAAHKNGDNIGLFQIIGSAGEVRNVNFSNIKVRGRTIVGVIAGNLAGTVYNCTIDSECKAEMGTHFYDDDCNMGGAFGIVGGSGNVYNVVSSVSSLTLGGRGAGNDDLGVYIDYDDKYKTEDGGNGWDHQTGNPDCNWWKFCGVDKGDGQVMDSNGAPSNGEYAFVGKCWGKVSNCVAKAFNYAPMNGASRAIYFGQTHIGKNKPTSGEDNMGALENCKLLSDEQMKDPSQYETFPQEAWNFEQGKLPSLKNQYSFVA